jgi:phage tail-like protein
MAALLSSLTSMQSSSMLPATMRFKVVIQGQNIGSWSHCTGLSVKFENNTKMADPSSQELTVVPAQATYDSVKLRRAMTQKGAAEVTKWLKDYAKKPSTTMTATITLVDSWDLTICQWSLRNVVPRSWGCADLDGSSSTKTVALETLELSHSGFGELMDEDKKLGTHFTLTLGNSRLGAWTSCEGLNVEFQNTTLTSDKGNGRSDELCPGSTKYTDLTLKRLMVGEDSNSKNLQDFLRDWAKKPDKNVAQTGTLTLTDSWGNNLGTWDLHGVIPKKWTGPTLDSSKKEPAVETLVLSYTGFLTDGKVGGGFTVQVGNEDLGSWTVLNGLGVDFPTGQVKKAGGTATKPVPKGAPTYGDVTLQRPLNSKVAADLQRWLSQAADKRGQDVTITVQDAWGDDGAKWMLRNAIPKSWKGPNLEIQSNKVPMETLVIAHDGFVQESSGGGGGGKAPSGAQNNTAAKGTTSDGAALEQQFATLTDASSNTVTFAADPHSMTRSRTARYVAVPSGTGSATVGHGRNEYRGSGAATLTVEVDLLGLGEDAKASVEKQCEQLEKWMKPSSSAKPPALLTFKWGSGDSVSFQGYMRDLAITIDEFGSDKKPSRASARFTLQEEPAPPPPTNPTSGGPPGRRSHVLCEGESLQSVAYREYGNAAAWRMLADVNGIDDPLRLAPGTQLLIPPAT